MNRPFFILSLDGGGSLGVYTLGVLSEVERMLGRPLHEVFHLAYGVSTGSIIASMVALGDPVEPNRLRIAISSLRPTCWGLCSRAPKQRRWSGTRKEYTARKLLRISRWTSESSPRIAEHNRPMVFKRIADTGSAVALAVFFPGFGPQNIGCDYRLVRCLSVFETKAHRHAPSRRTHRAGRRVQRRTTPPFSPSRTPLGPLGVARGGYPDTERRRRGVIPRRANGRRRIIAGSHGRS